MHLSYISIWTIKEFVPFHDHLPTIILVPFRNPKLTTFFPHRRRLLPRRPLRVPTMQKRRPMPSGQHHYRRLLLRLPSRLHRLQVHGGRGRMLQRFRTLPPWPLLQHPRVVHLRLRPRVHGQGLRCGVRAVWTLAVSARWEMYASRSAAVRVRLSYWWVFWSNFLVRDFSVR